MSTLGQLITEAKGLLYEVQGTPGAEDPFGWQNQAVWATNEISRRCYALYLEGTIDITTSTSQYCLPADVFKIRTVAEQMASGDWLNLPCQTTQVMNRQRGAWWQTTTPSDPARIAVINDPTFGITLWPAPSVSRTAALKIAGQWIPNEIWGFTTGGTAIYCIDTATNLPNLSTENPLPRWCHYAIPAGMALRRCMVFPSPENLIRRPFLQEEWENHVGKIHGAVSTYSPPAQVGAYFGAGAWGRW